MCDPVKGVGYEEQLNVVLSEACWGKWDDAGADAAVDAASKRRAAMTWRLEKGPTAEAQAGLVTYADLLEEVLHVEKKELQALKNTFTQPGQPGESVRGVYDDLKASLLLPSGTSLRDAPPIVGEGSHFLIPSFLNLVLKLQQDGRDFRIIFRTFGTDGANVLKQFNLFCSGGHPSYPDVPPDLSKWAVRTPGGTGEWYRDDSDLHLSICKEVDGVELVQQLHGAAECAAALRTKLFACPVTHSLMLRDYFPHWRRCGEACDAGKPLLVERPITGMAHHIFFDDNIERGRAHIVDARDAATGEPLPFCTTSGIHLIRAEPLEAIRDPEYFVKAVVAAEKAFTLSAAACGT